LKRGRGSSFGFLKIANEPYLKDQKGRKKRSGCGEGSSQQTTQRKKKKQKNNKKKTKKKKPPQKASVVVDRGEGAITNSVTTTGWKRYKLLTKGDKRGAEKEDRTLPGERLEGCFRPVSPAATDATTRKRGGKN